MAFYGNRLNEHGEVDYPIQGEVAEMVRWDRQGISGDLSGDMIVSTMFVCTCTIGMQGSQQYIS